MGGNVWLIVCVILAIVLAIVGTIVSFILIVPDKRRNALPKFFKFLHDLFNFKFLSIEKIMQAFYIFSTFYVVVYGFFFLFTFTEDRRGNISWEGWIGFLIMLLGPVVIRIAYEMLMMFIILVKNTNQINNKLGTSYAETPKKADAPAAPATPAAPAAQAPVQEGWFCTQCGYKNAEGSSFCNSCGKAK